jgi:UDP-N-acetyl-D-galactosamine dehydrogenase
MEVRITVIGLGYVGLPLALALAEKFPGTVGFDINLERVRTLKQGIDCQGEVPSQVLKASSLKMTSHLKDLADSNFWIVAVPTNLDRCHQPDLTALIKASEMIGRLLKSGDVVVYEGTVYPGVTEEICGPILAEVSGLRRGEDFKLGYSPERINPGDRVHTLKNIVKVVAGEDSETRERIAKIYGTIIKAGVYQAPSIKVAEAAKLIENVQRDLNIALLNEFAIVCDHLNLSTREVLAAAATKWNFLPFTPGLVGGYCIDLASHYLSAKAAELGYHPQLIQAGRQINDSMATYLGQRFIELLGQANIAIQGARVGILGLTFKENVRELRNSHVPELVVKLKQVGLETLVHDPLADAQVAQQEYGIALAGWQDLHNLDAMILAVRHQSYLDMTSERLLAGLRSGGVLMDIKSALNPSTIPPTINYWSL